MLLKFYPKNFNFNYELFNCNKFSIRYWSWNYRGCWHQTCPPIKLVKRFRLYLFQLPSVKLIGINIYCHYFPVLGLKVVAISQAPSPESNPNSPLPVTTMVGQYRTIES
eukprot:gene4053-4699_t